MVEYYIKCLWEFNMEDIFGFEVELEFFFVAITSTIVSQIWLGHWFIHFLGRLVF